MAKLSEQIKKANVSNILKKVKSNKVVSKQELEAIEEFEQQQETERVVNSSIYYMSLKETADFFSVTDRCLQKWAKEAGMPKEAEGVYNLKKCFDWWKENINSGVTNEEKEVRARYWLAKAEGEEIKIARIKGELIKRESVANEFAQRASDLKTTLRALKYRISGLLVGKSQEEIMQTLETEIDEMLRAFVRKGKYIEHEEKPQEIEEIQSPESREKTKLSKLFNKEIEALDPLKSHFQRRKERKIKQLQKKLLNKQPKPKKGTKKK